MAKEVNVLSWIKWMLGIVRAKYWFNLFWLAVAGLLAHTTYSAATAANCGPCAGFGWGILTFFVLLINVIVFFVSEPDDFDEFWKEVYGTIRNFIKYQWNRITDHFNWWWKDRPKD